MLISKKGCNAVFLERGNPAKIYPFLEDIFSFSSSLSLDAVSSPLKHTLLPQSGVRHTDTKILRLCVYLLLIV